MDRLSDTGSVIKQEKDEDTQLVSKLKKFAAARDSETFDDLKKIVDRLAINNALFCEEMQRLR